MKKVFTLLIALLFATTISWAQTSNYLNGFETTGSSGDWGSTTIRASGHNGIPASSGSSYGETGQGDFTRFGGYNYIFPTWGYKTSVDIYLNVNGGYSNDKKFDYTSAISNTTSGHTRDFMFNGGFYNDNVGLGANTNRFIFTASNNSVGWPRNPALTQIAISTSGWYTFEHTFYNNGSGVLAVDLKIFNSSSVLMGSWTLSNSTDIIGTTVGGNRYGWMVTNQLGTLAIDNCALTLIPPPPVRVYSDNTATTLLSGHNTIQAGINAAVNGNLVQVDAGTYEETAISINKAITLKGSNAGLAGNNISRTAEARIKNTSISVTAAAILDGFEIYQTNDKLDAILVQSAATVKNSIIRREGVNTGVSARGITTASSQSGFALQNNLFTGSTSGGLFGGHKTWNSGIYLNGGSGSISNNVFENCRTAINADDFNAGITISGNTFQNSGTYISFGGVTPTNGQYVLGSNEFKTFISTMINLSNVNNAFRLDITSSTYNGLVFSSLPLSTLFTVEYGMYHRGRIVSRLGNIIYVPNNLYVLPNLSGIQAANNYANPGDLINVAPGTYNENVTVTKALTLNGANANIPCGSRGAESKITPTTNGSIPVTISSDNVTFNGFELSAPASPYALSTGSTGRSNMIVKYNYIHDVGTAYTGNVHSIQYNVANAVNTSNVTIANNCFDNINNVVNTASGSAIGILQSPSTGTISNLLIESNTISNVNSKNASTGGKGAYGIIVNVGAVGGGSAINPIIRNNSISNLSGRWAHAIGLEGNTPGALVTNNLINNLSSTKLPPDACGVMVEGNTGASTVNVNENSFTNTSYGIINVTSGLVNATCNWFGTTNAADVAGKIFGSVNNTSYLTNGTDNETTTPGFQPVPGSCNGSNVMSITCPASVTFQCASEVPAPDPNTVTVNGTCPGVIVSHVGDVITGQTCTNFYTLTRTYKATDDCGNVATCAQKITVNDLTAPVITSIPANTSVSCVSEVPGANNGAVAVTDNCGGAVTVTSADVITPGNCANRFSIARTYTAKDVCGNTASKTQTITVNDQTAPVITCPGNNTINAVTTCGTAVTFNLPTASDNCGTPVVTQTGGLESGSVFPIGTSTVTFKATDDCGNTATCSITITVIENPEVSTVYTILAEEEVHIQNYNYVYGNVGVWKAGKEDVKILNHSVVVGFVKAPKINIDKSSAINGASIYGAAPAPSTPFMRNTQSDPPSDITIADNTIGTFNLVGDKFRKITIGKNAVAKFTSSGNIYIKELIIKDSDKEKQTTLQFSGTTNLIIREKLDIGKRNNINPDGKVVNMYVEKSNVPVGESSLVRANIDVRFKELLPENAKEGSETKMYGTFIAKKVKNGSRINWYGPCRSASASSSPAPAAVAALKSEVIFLSDNLGEGFEVKVYPNPTTSQFTLKFNKLSNDNLLIKLTDMSGRTLLIQNFTETDEIKLGENLAPGTYLSEIIQGNHRKVVKLIKTW